MRVVVDTNLILSAILHGGKPFHLLQLALTQRVTLVSTAALLDELADVLSRRKFAARLAQTGQSVAALMTDYRLLVEVVAPADIRPTVTADPDDDAVLACALGGEADFIVTGDHHLLNLKRVHHIKILTANDFLALFESVVSES